MPRLVYLTGVGIGLLAVAFALTCRLTWRPGVTAANAGRIRPGMTLPQVEAIFGGQADTEATVRLHPKVERARGWATSEGAASVVFDGRDRVVRAYFLRDFRAINSKLPRLLDRFLGW